MPSYKITAEYTYEGIVEARSEDDLNEDEECEGCADDA